VNNKKGLFASPFLLFKNVPDAIICRQVQPEPVTQPELQTEPVREQEPVPELQQASGPPLSSGIQWLALRTEPLLK
jgi:hypothetical protein